MTNLLEETLGILEANNRTEEDILWVGSTLIKTSWSDFKQTANIVFDASYGAPEVAENLLIVGKDFWLQRGEYDGAEWWEFMARPVEPETVFELKALTVGQSKSLGLSDSIGWSTLEYLNDLE